MSDPLIDPSDLGTYLNDPDIDALRAEFFIDQAQSLCESILSPLPDTARVVVTRVAGRGYVSVTSPRQQQLAAAGSPYSAAGGMGGLSLYDEDIADLRRLAGGGGAFSVDLLPAGWVAPATPGWCDADWQF